MSSFEFIQALTTNTYAVNDGETHAGYRRYNERDETFNELYSVPVGDSPTCIEILMGATLSQAHYSRTIDRALILMGFYPEVAEAFADRFVAQAEETGWDSAAERFSGWFVNGWVTRDYTYKGVTIAQDDLVDCIASTTPTAQPPYTIPLVPGWNLISFPGTLVQPNLADVFSPDLAAVFVLGYSEGEWQSAIRTDEGWAGESPPELLPGYGYWVSTDQYEELAIPLQPVPSDTLLPDLVSLVGGWNLIGVVDAQLPRYGVTHSGRLTMDDYLGETPWGVGYVYSTGTEEWTKFLPGDGSVLQVGSGYWLWAGNEPPPDEPPPIE